MQKRGLICVGLGFVLILVAAASVEVEGPNLVTWIMLAACASFFVAGMTLIALGSRGEKKEGQGEH